MSRNQKGFTLIELLIVVVIIGILAAIAIPKFANTKEKAYVASMKSDLRNLITAQEAYFSDNNSNYAQSTTNLGTNYKASSGITVTLGSVTNTGWTRDLNKRLDGQDLHDAARRRINGRRRSGLPVVCSDT